MLLKFYIRLLCLNLVSALVQLGWLNYLADQIKSLQPYEILFLDDGTTQTYSKEQDLVIRTLGEEIPFMIMNVNQNSSVQNKFQSHNVSFKKYKTIVIIFGILENDTIRRTIDFLTTMTYNVPPNTLLISFDIAAKEETTFYQIVESILSYGWSKKFLDLTILTVKASHGDSEPMVNTYSLNPFHGNASGKLIDSGSNQLFPYKLENLNGHPITFPFINIPPISTMKKYENGSLGIDGVFYQPINFVLTQMNLTKVATIEIDSSSARKAIESTNQIILSGKTDMIISPSPSKIIERGVLQVDRETDCDKIIAVVPVLFKKIFNIPVIIFFHVCAIILVILTIISIKYLISMADIQWPSLHIFALILGVPVNMESRTVCSKIIYLCIALISIVYSNELFLCILSINILQIEVPFETYEDIDSSHLPIISAQYAYDTAFPDPESVTDPHLRNIMHKIIRITGAANIMKLCFDELSDGAEQICIMSLSLAKSYMENYISSSGASFLNMKIAEPALACERWNLVFEPSSPYAERFLEIQRRMYEGGYLYELEFFDQLFVEASEPEQIPFDIDIFTPKELFLLLIIGYILSIIIMFIEVLWKKIRAS